MVMHEGDERNSGYDGHRYDRLDVFASDRHDARIEAIVGLEPVDDDRSADSQVTVAESAS